MLSKLVEDECGPIETGITFDLNMDFDIWMFSTRSKVWILG